MRTKGDYKDRIQEIADRIADKEYDKDFYDLPNDKQIEVYQVAMDEYYDNLADLTDLMIDKKRLKELGME